MQFGFLNRVYAPEFDRRVLASAVDLICAAEQLGLASAWVAQHHVAVESGRLPSPLVLLAAAAERTHVIRLGTGVVVLPLESVLRLAEDASVLDALSEGRLELGLGAGFDRHTFAAFGWRVEDRHVAYNTNLQRLQLLLEGAPAGTVSGEAVCAVSDVTHSEDSYGVSRFSGAAPPDHVACSLQPSAPGLRGRIWEAGSRTDAIVANRNGLLVAPRGPGAESENDLIFRYNSAWQGSGTSDRPRVALVRGLFVGSGRAQIEAEIGPDIRAYVERFGSQLGTVALPEVLRRLGVLWGSAQQIVDEIGEHGVLRGVTHFIAQVQTRTTSHASALERLELFAEEIVPALRRLAS